MVAWSPSSLQSPGDLPDLGLTAEIVHRALFAAVTDAQLCTEADAPTASGFILWTRANRYLREELVPAGWTIQQKDLILRTIHPSETFAITAISASGDVGQIGARNVRAKNPKGAAVKRVVDKNGTAPFVFGDPRVDDVPVEDEDIPTWFLLYKWQEGVIHTELSYPIDMSGSFVDKWKPRLLINPLEVTGFSHDIDDPGSGPDFTVEPR